MGSSLSKSRGGIVEKEKEIEEEKTTSAHDAITNQTPKSEAQDDDAFLRKAQEQAAEDFDVIQAKKDGVPYDIAVIVDAGLHKDDFGEGSSSLSIRRTPSAVVAHGQTLQDAVQELKAKFDINAPLPDYNNSELENIRKEIDAEGQTLDAERRKRRASMYVYRTPCVFQN